MKLQNSPPLHLTYCLNIHPGETWDQNLATIRGKALEVRDAVAPDGPFGLGLRLSRRAVEPLLSPAALDEFRRVMAEEDLYAFTINGFPYGPFHGTPVKQSVYQPDWRRPERRDYTLLLADVLAAVLPEGVSGSISTVPGSYKPWIEGDDDVAAMTTMLADVAFHLHQIHQRDGRDIALALEPEPDCHLETTDEAIAFFTGPLLEGGAARLRESGLSASRAESALRRHIGVCFDTAHAAVQFEDLPGALARLASAGVRIPKVQLSAALSVTPTPETRARLRDFCDAVYLHQVKARTAEATLSSYPDLPAALDDSRAPEGEWRVHFHVPLFFEEFGGLRSTAPLLLGPFAAALAAGATEHLEIETYTFDVLPDALRPDDVADCIAGEYRWVLDRLLPSAVA